MTGIDLCGSAGWVIRVSHVLAYATYSVHSLLSLWAGAKWSISQVNALLEIVALASPWMPGLENALTWSVSDAGEYARGL